MSDDKHGLQTKVLAAIRDGSALKSLLDHSVPYEKAGAPLPFDLAQFGFLGGGLLVACALAGLIAPQPATIEQGGLFLILGGLAAGIAQFLREIAPAALLTGLGFALVDLLLLGTPSGEWSRWLVTAQLVAGIGVASPAVLAIAVVALNIALWVAIIAVVFLVLLALVAAAFAGG